MGFAQSFWISMDSVLSDPTLEPSYATDWTQWAGAIVGACLVGLTGVLPLWVIPAKALGTAPSAPTEDNLKYLLAFAVGGLLGDVFLHLLPETYQHVIDSGEEGGLFRIGVATLTGVLAFLVLEKVLEMSNPETNLELREKENKKIVGYLNLLANCTGRFAWCPRCSGIREQPRSRDATHVYPSLHSWGFPQHCPRLCCTRTHGGEKTLASILPVPLLIGWHQCHVPAHHDVARCTYKKISQK